MKVKELVATLLTLPQDFEVYTEQFNSNNIAEVAVNKSEGFIIIGDDLDDVTAADKELFKTLILDNPVVYMVFLESRDEGIPYNDFELFSTYEDAKAFFEDCVKEEKKIRNDFVELENAIDLEPADYYRWADEKTGNFSYITIHEIVL